MKTLALLLALATCAIAAQTPADITLTTGEVLKAARVIAVGEKTATIASGGGVKIVEISLLPPDVTERAKEALWTHYSATPDAPQIKPESLPPVQVANISPPRADFPFGWPLLCGVITVLFIIAWMNVATRDKHTFSARVAVIPGISPPAIQTGLKPCPSCGNGVADGARTCPKCGHTFTTAGGVFIAVIIALVIGGCVMSR